MHINLRTRMYATNEYWPDVTLWAPKCPDVTYYPIRFSTEGQFSESWTNYTNRFPI